MQIRPWSVSPCAVVCAGLLLCCGVMVMALPVEAYDWSVGGALFYQTGDYGSDTSSDLIYIPVTVRRYLSRGDFSLTIPYLSLRTDNDPATDGNGSRTESGLGDISLKGRYHAVAQKDWKPFVDLFARIKLPTADEGKGLGTGETDFSLGAEMVRRVGAKVLAFLDLGYTWIGSPSDADYNNRLAWDAGIGYEVRSDLLVSFFYEQRSAITDAGKESRSVYALVNWLMRRDRTVYGMIETGISGGPDLGVALGFSRKL